MKAILIVLSLLMLMQFEFAQARVHKNLAVGEYQAVIDLNQYIGQPFFKTMKEVIYPEMNTQAEKRERGSHVAGIYRGEGVEVYLTQDITTFHVKYKADWEEKVERSGRSFGAVGEGRVRNYVADASYLHYLRTLERLLEKSSDEEVATFYQAIISVVVNSDPTMLNELNVYGKRVAADFIAIYIAEQYRRLTATKGKYLGRSHRWDDALLQVTLLAAFHSGQTKKMFMFYEGQFTYEVYPQSACLYKAKNKDEEKRNTKKRTARLSDYWQFSVRSECPGRSGVNLTRRDFQKLGNALTRELRAAAEIDFKTMGLKDGRRFNFFKEITENLLNGTLKVQASQLMTETVKTLMFTREKAQEITDSLKKTL